MSTTPADDLPLSSGLEVVPGLVGHLSASSVSTYLKCPRRFWYEKVAKVPSRADEGLVAGLGFHDAAEFGCSYKIAHKQEPPLDVVLDVARDKTGARAEGEDLDATDTTKAVDKSVRLARTWAKDFLPKVEPMFVEQEFSVEVGDVRVLGRIDMVDVSGEIFDWKTKQKAPSADSAFKAIQSEVYPLVHPGAPVTYVYMVDYPKKGVQIMTQTVPYESVVTTFATETVRDVARGIRAGSFPRRRDGWHCSEKWCPHYFDCIQNPKGLRP